jgi:phosphoribosylformylglycinamidine (FGAM) synthase PurS component
MKKLITILSASAILLALPLQAANSFDTNPGYIDFDKYVSLHAEDSKVEVQLKGPLLKLAASIIEAQNENLSGLISSVELVRVHVYEVNDDNREQFAESVRSIAQNLTDNNWEQLVMVKDGDENVAVFANMPTDEVIAGIVVSVSSGNEAVFINVVGNVALESLAELGKQLDIPQLNKIGEMLEES